MIFFKPHCCKKYIPTLYARLLSEHTELLLIINLLIICNNKKDYMSLGLGMFIFLTTVSDRLEKVYYYYILFT